MAITRISVNGKIHQIDYEGLANKPDLTKDIEPIANSDNYITSGAVFTALENLSIDKYRLTSLEQTLALIDQRLTAIESSTSTSVSGEKLSLSGPQVNEVGSKLSLSGSEFSVTGEKLSIS